MEISNQANTNSITHGLPRRDSAEMLNTSLKPNEPSYYDDLYDFNDIPLDDPAAMAHMYPNGLLNTDEDTDEDINLDYGYGYDYERVIKDRLKAANDAFASDSATPLKKNTKVSFDSTVTAIDDPEVPVIEQKNIENNRIHFQNGIPEENIPGMNDQNTENSKASIKFALPLNDTVEKENPDDFANKLRAANARYDALTSSLDHTHNNNINNEDNESQVVPTTKKSLNEPDSNKTVKFLSTETNNINNNNNNNNTSNQKADSPKLQNNNNGDSVNINSTKTDNTKSNNFFMQKSSSPSTSPELNKPKITQFSNILIDSNKKDNSRTSSTSPNNDDNKSNTTTVKINGTSSPLQKTSTSPTSTTKPIETKKSVEVSAPTIDDKSDTKAKAPQEKKGTGQKVVLEKDGQFLLVDSDEYTATEKFRASAEKTDQSAADSKKSTPLIPRPPERPKTSNGRSTNVYTIKPKSTTEEKRVSSANPSSVKHVRQSRSADAAGRSRDKNSKSPIEFDRTPEYAQFYKSPYAFPKKKPFDKNDEYKKKEEEQKKEEERQQENEIAFKYWLEKKEKERRESKEKQNNDKKERSTSSTRSSTQSRPTMTFDDWLKQKKTIILEQRKEQQKMQQYEYEDRLPPHTIEERQAVFRDWLKKKYREKHQAKELEKLERKKWANRCRKSRKHQRLSQAIELAQAYGYTSYYYTTGFNY